MNVNVAMVRSNALTCTFQRNCLVAAVKEILYVADREKRYFDEKISSAPYVKVFMSIENSEGVGQLEEHSLRQLREDLEAGDVHEACEHCVDGDEEVTR